MLGYLFDYTQFFDSGTPNLTVAVGSFENRFSNRFFLHPLSNTTPRVWALALRSGQQKCSALSWLQFTDQPFFQKSMNRSIILEHVKNGSF